MAGAPHVGIVMGSESDREVLLAAVAQLDELGVPSETRVISAHRSPKLAVRFAETAKDRGLKVIIAAAGKAAHLAGVMAAHTTLPVIGVPIESKDLGGLDSLLSTVQMPPGVPVATVAINGSRNAAVLAAQMIALGDPAVAEKLSEMKQDMERALVSMSGEGLLP